MSILYKRIGPALLAGSVVLGLQVPATWAQRVQTAGTRQGPGSAGLYPWMQVAPGLNLQQAAYNTALMGHAYSNFPPYAMGFAAPYALGYSPGSFPGVAYPGFSQALANSNLGNPYVTGAMLSNPYLGSGYSAAMTSGGGYGGGYGGYPSTYVSSADPYSGYLRGSADVINSQGRFLINWQQSRILNEDRRRARIENRRRIFDEYMYEQAHRIPYAEMVARQNELNLRTYINNPSEAQLGSAEALNAMLADAEKLNPKNPPSIGLDGDVLRNINITSPGNTNGNVSLLRDVGNLRWPLAFRGEPFHTDMETIKTYLPQAVNDAKADHAPDRSVIDKLMTARNDLDRQLRANVNNLPPSEWVDARHFLDHLTNGLTALANGTAGKFLAIDLPANAKSVADLVQYMGSHGLQFAPAVQGQESDYAALHHALAVYDATAHTQAQQVSNTAPGAKVESR